MNIDKRVSAALFNIFNEHSSILSAYYELGDEEAIFCIEFKENSPIFLYCPFGDLWSISDVLIKGKRQVRKEELKSSCMMLGLKEDLVTMLVYKLGQEVRKYQEYIHDESLTSFYRKEKSRLVIENQRNLIVFDSLLSKYEKIETLNLSVTGMNEIELAVKLTNQFHFTLKIKDSKFEYVSMKQDNQYSPKISSDETIEFYNQEDIECFLKYASLTEENFKTFVSELVQFIQQFDGHLEKFDLSIVSQNQQLDYIKG